MRLYLLCNSIISEGHQPTIAVDLDGTLTKGGKYRGPDHFADIRDGAKEALDKFKKLGYRIIIFTVRGDKQKVSDWLDENEIPFDHVNENPDQPSDSSGKVLADIYIDDRAVSARNDWPDIVRKVKKRLSKS